MLFPKITHSLILLPLSLSLFDVLTPSRHKLYKSAKDFDTDMAGIFEKARRWHDAGTEATLLLQVKAPDFWVITYFRGPSYSFPFSLMIIASLPSHHVM